MSLNDRNIGTYSQAITKVTTLKKFIIDTIDSIPQVKLLCRYNDKSPLSKRGEDYAGKIIVHTGLTTTLTKDTLEGKKNLYSGLFDEETVNELKNMIFVYPVIMDVGKTINKYLFEINILVNQQYNELANYGQERIFEIASYIVEALDDYTIENNEIVDIVGNVKFEVKGRVLIERLTNNATYISLRIPIVVDSIGVRAYGDI